MNIRARFGLQKGQFQLAAELEVPATGVTALFGRSGAGKTLLLRCVAGLERAADGLLWVGGQCWQDTTQGLFLPPHRRAVGYVFQHSALFPHLDVRGNLRYGFRRAPASRRRVSVEQAVAWLGIEHLLDRQSDGLSGGERQRVAIARALLGGPQLLLMDEPLAALDAAAKAEILPYLERLHDGLSIPTIYVSHALPEVERLADRILLLEGGRVRASGTVAELAGRLDLPLAYADDAAAVVEAEVVNHDPDYHLSYLGFPGGRISIAQVSAQPGQRVRVRVLARDVSLALERPQRTSILNIFPATVIEVGTHSPAQRIVKLDAAGSTLLARVTLKSCQQLGLEPGLALFAQVKSVALVS